MKSVVRPNETLPLDKVWSKLIAAVTRPGWCPGSGLALTTFTRNVARQGYAFLWLVA